MPTRSNLGAKDYELIAATLLDSFLGFDDRLDLALDFADRLVVTSDSFDPIRFVESSGGNVKDVRDRVRQHSTALRLRVEALEARRSER